MTPLLSTIKARLWALLVLLNVLLALLGAWSLYNLERASVSLEDLYAAKLLNIESLEQAALLVTVSIPAGAPEKAVLNLTGPIVINYEARMGLQVPQSADGPQQVNMHTLQPVEPDSSAAAPAAAEAAPQK